MSLLAKKTGGDYVPVPQGTHLAICYGLIDLGTQTEQFGTKAPRNVHKVRVVWELPNERTADNKPMSIGTFYSVSLHEKSTMRKHLEAWRGRPFTDEEMAGFKLVNIVGKPCMIVVVHKPRDGGGVSDSIASVSMPMKGLTIPPLENKQLVLDLDHFDKAVYNALPDFLKNKIKVSPEGAEKLGFKPGIQNQNGGVTEADERAGAIPF